MRSYHQVCAKFNSRSAIITEFSINFIPQSSTQLSGRAEADYSTTVHCVRSMNSLQRIQGNPDYSTLGSFQVMSKNETSL